MITRRQPPVKQNPQSFLHPRKIAENRRKTQKRCNFNLQAGCGLGRQNDLKWLPLLPGCGTQHPHRALGGTRVLLAAAPTTPPCFRRWRRSSSLLAMFSGNNIYIFAFGALQTLFSREGSERETAFAAPLSAKAQRCGRALAPPRGSCRAATEGLLMEKRKKR